MGGSGMQTFRIPLRRVMMDDLAVARTVKFEDGRSGSTV